MCRNEVTKLSATLCSCSPGLRLYPNRKWVTSNKRQPLECTGVWYLYISWRTYTIALFFLFLSFFCVCFLKHVRPELTYWTNNQLNSSSNITLTCLGQSLRMLQQSSQYAVSQTFCHQIIVITDGSVSGQEQGQFLNCFYLVRLLSCRLPWPSYQVSWADCFLRFCLLLWSLSMSKMTLLFSLWHLMTSSHLVKLSRSIKVFNYGRGLLFCCNILSDCTFPVSFSLSQTPQSSFVFIPYLVKEYLHIGCRGVQQLTFHTAVVQFYSWVGLNMVLLLHLLLIWANSSLYIKLIHCFENMSHEGSGTF